MMSVLIQLSIAFLVLAVYSSWISIHVRSEYRFKWLHAPLLLGVALFVLWKLPDLEGYPFEGYPQGQFEYIDHKVEGHGSDKAIKLWAKVGKGESRLYSIPYDAQTEAELNAAHSESQHGLSVHGEFKRGGEGRIHGDGQSMAGAEDLTTVVQPQVTLPPKQSDAQP